MKKKSEAVEQLLDLRRHRPSILISFQFRRRLPVGAFLVVFFFGLIISFHFLLFVKKKVNETNL